MRRLLLPSLVAALLLSALPLTGSGPASAAAPTASPAERWALVVGVTDYAGRTHSTVAGARDAGLVKNVLLAQGWKSDHIRVLTEGHATAQAVSEGLTWLVSKSSPSTFTMFHYSGHVKQTSAGEYLWPYDNRFLRDVDVARVLRGLQGTSWVDIAGCESGGFQEGLATNDRLFTSSSRVSEKSYESPQWGMSVWAGLLFDQAIRDKDADADHDRKVSVQEAYQWATPRAAAITAKQQPHGPQHPQHAGWRGSLNLANPRTLR
ncbi:MAG: hypothetical protein JWN17_22 [Frankiales bacterium]|nr:hypothetical protein [Frankiales bacterium]